MLVAWSSGSHRSSHTRHKWVCTGAVSGMDWRVSHETSFPGHSVLLGIRCFQVNQVKPHSLGK